MAFHGHPHQKVDFPGLNQRGGTFNHGRRIVRPKMFASKAGTESEIRAVFLIAWADSDLNPSLAD